MTYRNLRDFIAQLEQLGELKRVSAAVSPHLEMTALCDRTLRAGGSALLFENPTGHSMPVLGNLFGTTRRVALGMGVSDVSKLRQFAHVLAILKDPEAPKGFKELMGLRSMIKTLWNMAPKEQRSAACQDVVWEGADVDLSRLPVQHYWPDDVAPLITWGLVIYPGPAQGASKLGHLPPAGVGPQQGHRALAAPPRRRAGLSGARRTPPGPALSRVRGPRGRPGHHSGCRRPGFRQSLGIPIFRPAAR
jgi:4-hydroxy-3-polyprenylbenzoate decarboxylase